MIRVPSHILHHAFLVGSFTLLWNFLSTKVRFAEKKCRNILDRLHLSQSNPYTSPVNIPSFCVRACSQSDVIPGGSVVWWPATERKTCFLEQTYYSTWPLALHCHVTSCRQTLRLVDQTCALLGLAVGTKNFGFQTCRLHGDTELCPRAY
jgi:hypothetical protein